MKILFYPSTVAPIHAGSVDERPLGGTETVIIRLAEELHRLGHDVTVLTALNNPPLSTPLYLPYRAAFDIGPVDLLIAVREWRPLFLPIQAKRRVYFTGDAADLLQNYGMGDKRVAARIDAFLAASPWQASEISRASGYPDEKIYIMGHGIHPPFFSAHEVRNRQRLIYSSTPYKGLSLLADIYPLLLARHPNIELHIFSGLEVYQGAEGIDPRLASQAKITLDKLRTFPGCKVHGNILQKDLAREFLRSSILAYPNTFPETFGITALEAQAAGCPVVTSALGALPTTVGEAGILISAPPTSVQYRNEFIDAVSRLLTDDQHWSSLSEKGFARAQHLRWSDIAERLEQFLGGLV